MAKKQVVRSDRLVAVKLTLPRHLKKVLSKVAKRAGMSEGRVIEEVWRTQERIKLFSEWQQHILEKKLGIGFKGYKPRHYL